MFVKIIGAALIMISCGGVGIKMVWMHREEEQSLKEFIRILDFIECEMQYRVTSFPEICRQIECTFSQKFSSFFGHLVQEIGAMHFQNVDMCFRETLEHCDNLPPLTVKNLSLLGNSICRFDLEGQITEINAVRDSCKKDLAALELNRDERFRSYQTLGLCAGAALAILFV